MIFLFILIPAVCDVKANKAYKVLLNGESLTFFSSDQLSVTEVAKELNSDSYKLSQLTFKVGDVVVDIGGNVGMFAISLAKKYPFLQIYSFEPVKQAIENFKRNIKVNNIPAGIITVIPKAITNNGKNITMFLEQSSIGNIMSKFVNDTAYRHRYLKSEKVESMTLTQVFDNFEIKQCKLLKMDCEGCEYESLYGTKAEILKKVEVFRGEFHTLTSLVKKGITPSKLLADMRGNFSDIHVEFPISKSKIAKKKIKKKNL